MQLVSKYKSPNICPDIPNELPRKPEEGLLEVVVRLRRNFEVLDILLPVECYVAGLNLALL